MAAANLCGKSGGWKRVILRLGWLFSLSGTAMDRVEMMRLWRRYTGDLMEVAEKVWHRSELQEFEASGAKAPSILLALRGG